MIKDTFLSNRYSERPFRDDHPSSIIMDNLDSTLPGARFSFTNRTIAHPYTGILSDDRMIGQFSVSSSFLKNGGGTRADIYYVPLRGIMPQSEALYSMMYAIRSLIYQSYLYLSSPGPSSIPLVIGSKINSVIRVYRIVSMIENTQSFLQFRYMPGTNDFELRQRVFRGSGEDTLSTLYLSGPRSSGNIAFIVSDGFTKPPSGSMNDASVCLPILPITHGTATYSTKNGLNNREVGMTFETYNVSGTGHDLSTGSITSFYLILIPVAV